jgi:hypothetical protein
MPEHNLMKLTAKDRKMLRSLNRTQHFPSSSSGAGRPGYYHHVARGGAVVEALRYKPEGRGIDSRWCHWNFSLT